MGRRSQTEGGSAGGVWVGSSCRVCAGVALGLVHQLRVNWIAAPAEQCERSRGCARPSIGRRMCALPYRPFLSGLLCAVIGAVGGRDLHGATSPPPDAGGDFKKRQAVQGRDQATWSKHSQGLRLREGWPVWPIGLASNCGQGGVQGMESVGRSGHSGPFSYVIRLISGCGGQ